MSERPLYDALFKRAHEGLLRFHMPGHKGKTEGSLPILDISLDFTELPGTGSLYEGIPPISEAERLCAEAWGAKDAFFLTGGSSQGVRAAVFAACSPGGTIICDRNAHSSLASALIMLDLRCEYIEADEVGGFCVSGRIDPERLDCLIEKTPDARAVFITSPSYYGVIQDIKAIAAVCKRHGLPLIVDEAHGAHFPFLEGYAGAVKNGADLAVCSMHKTLPALGQSALLTSSGRFEADNLRHACQMFGSASPSYLMMANMDLVRSFMTCEGASRQNELAFALRGFCLELERSGMDILSSHVPCDPLRLCVSAASVGISGREGLKILEERGVSPEMADSFNLIFIISVFDDQASLEGLFRSLKALARSKSPPIMAKGIAPPAARQVLRPREAALARERPVSLKNSEGLVSSRVISVFPPGIQLVGPGEKISAEHIGFLLLQGEDGNRVIYTVE